MRSLLILTLFLFFRSLPVYPQWTEMSGPNQLILFSVAASGTNLLAGTDQNGVFVSTDLGTTWTQWNYEFDQIRDFAVSSDYTYVTSSRHGLYKSENNGINWIRSIPFDVDGLSVACLGSNIVLGTYNGVFLSFDQGSNWTNTSFLNNAAYDLLLTETHVFVATPVRGIYYSTNHGMNWLQGELNNQSVNALDKYEEKLFAGTDTNGVFTSINNGQTWNHTSMDTQEVLTIIHLNNNIFVGTGSEGVYHSSNEGESWIQINQGLSNLKVLKLTILGNYIFAATYSPNVWRRPLSEIIGITNTNSEIPENFKLHQNFPNPFNPTTTISFELTKSAYVELTVIDVSGKVCNTLVKEDLNAGSYSVDFSGAGLASGVYYYKLVASNLENARNLASVRKMVLLK
ncbi:MAG: T9SS type A sorting domain-containing protein [Ignavibacteria bacterium]